MKRKFCTVILVLGGCLVTVFAGNPAADTCVEKHTACLNSCTNAQASCKARGTVPETCENNYRHCTAECEKAKADCESKNPTASAPKKPAPKKPAPKKN